MVTLQERLHSTIEKYEVKDFSFLFEKLKGISENQINQHLTLYENYIKKMNVIEEKLKSVDKSDANPSYSEFRELQVEQTFVLNAIILHELYFSNLTDKSSEASECLMAVIERDFNSWDNYIEDIKATAKCSRGWAITAYNYRDGKIHNYSIDSHNLHVPVFVRPLLVVDVWEHAYMIDYGIKRPDYLEALFENINWHVVSQRFEAALKTEAGYQITE